LRQNFALFEKFPGYVFNFEGAYRYYLAKENYPAEYARLKTYVQNGNWAVAGGMVDMPDVNIPSAESLMRQILYGNGFFMDEFHKKSIHIMLPDNFGFTYALPTIASHMGMKGLSGMRIANCFPRPASPITRWLGPDGSSLIAICKTGDYANLNPTAIATADGDALFANTKGALWATWKYFGPRGDRGGAPTEASVSNLMVRIQDNANQPIKMVNASSDQLFLDLSPGQINALPEYRGEYHLPWAGCWTANAAIKLKNRQNEQRALAAEHAAVMANAYAGYVYPSEKIWHAWFGFLVHQQHDDICGTSDADADAATYEAMDASFGDFSQVLTDATTSFSTHLDTRVTQSDRIPLVVYNQLSTEREDVVEATVDLGAAAPAGVKVFDPAGQAVPAQILSATNGRAVIAFVAQVPSVSFSVYEVQRTGTANPLNPKLTINAATGVLENEYYRVTVDENGDVSGILDKSTQQQLLSAPSRLEGRTTTGDAYNISRNAMQAAPKWAVDESVVKTVAENGPARVSLKITRTKDGSSYTQYVRLAAGHAGTRVELDNTVDWKSVKTFLSVSFPMTSANPNATYDLGLGTIQRPNMSADPNRYDHVAQQWADITDQSQNYGFSILNDCKYGWHKPGDSSLYLELINGGAGGWGKYEGDHYVHHFKYAFYGHRGDWTHGTVLEAARLNQPLLAFSTSAHNGTAGRVVSFLQTSSPQVVVMALKKAEKSDAYVVRVREASGNANSGAKIILASEIRSASEIMGSEEAKPDGKVTVSDKNLVFDLTPYQPKTFTFTLKPAKSNLKPLLTPRNL
jgi:alpha-mannosidase